MHAVKYESRRREGRGGGRHEAEPEVGGGTFQPTTRCERGRDVLTDAVDVLADDVDVLADDVVPGLEFVAWWTREQIILQNCRGESVVGRGESVEGRGK